MSEGDFSEALFSELDFLGVAFSGVSLGELDFLGVAFSAGDFSAGAGVGVGRGGVTAAS
ncbi:hypothetical protein H6F85_14825 [Microcoleus sp. FACHB-45]|nr:hypothetical protein [Microcoleus sp. FACHB-84]MBD2009991.1 hypothetical protein [Microcoleus sp. FACHB-45]